LPLRELDERDRLPDERDDPLDDDFRWVLGAVLLGDERALGWAMRSHLSYVDVPRRCGVRTRERLRKTAVPPAFRRKPGRGS
jgi:hypothetical protein